MTPAQGASKCYLAVVKRCVHPPSGTSPAGGEKRTRKDALTYLQPYRNEKEAVIYHFRSPSLSELFQADKFSSVSVVLRARDTIFHPVFMPLKITREWHRYSKPCKKINKKEPETQFSIFKSLRNKTLVKYFLVLQKI